MTFAITEPTLGVKYASGVGVCPVDCILTAPEVSTYYIDPSRCSDRGYWESACPVNAIFSEFNVPSTWRG